MALVSPPLGATVPASPHATVVSLPTLADVEGYERKDPATLRHITVGYPRFVRNRLVGEAAARAAAALGRTGELFPLVSRVAALAWAARAGAAVSSLDEVGELALLAVLRPRRDEVEADVRNRSAEERSRHRRPARVAPS